MPNKDDSTFEIDLLSLAKSLLSKAYIIVLSAFVLGGLFFYKAAYKTVPLYSSSALMYVNNSSLSFVGGKLSITPGELDAAQSLVETYTVIAKSRTTLNEVIARGGLNYSYEQLKSMISINPINSTEIFSISVTSPNAKEAEYITNTVADVLPEAISKIVDGSSVRIVDYAVASNQKISPNITRETAIGMLIGAVISSAAIIITSIFNDSIKGKDDLLQNYDIPVLTVIPNFKSRPTYYKQNNEGKNEDKQKK